MSTSQGQIDVQPGQRPRRTRIGGPPVYPGVHWLTPWWRTWDAMQPPASSPDVYDEGEALEKVFRNTALIFQEGRPWPWARWGETFGSWQMWEEYRMAIGLTYRPVIRRFALDIPEDDSANLDYEDPTPRQPPINQHSDTYNHRIFNGIGACYDEANDRAAEHGMTRDEQKFRHEVERREKMARFILDPEKAMRHFFSAYFFNYGLATTPEAYNNIPVIASYFLRFLLQHVRFQDQLMGSLERALAVAELARRELPLIGTYVRLNAVARDEFSKFCTATFGLDLPDHLSLTTSSDHRSICSLDSDDSGSASSPTSNFSASPPYTPDCVAPTELPVVHDGTSGLADIGRSWLSSDGAMLADVDTALDTISVDDDPWAVKKPDLPIPDLALTHERGLVESSVRRIIGVYPPVTEPSTFGEDVEQTLVRKLWTIELAAQPSFRSRLTPDFELWEGYESATLRVQVDSRDSRDATIRLLVSPFVGTVLKRCIGMLLCGNFAELAPSSGGKGELWYLHQFVGLAPSFYEPDRPELDEETLRRVREPPAKVERSTSST